MELWRTTRYQRGRSEAEVQREIAEGLAGGRFRLPRRPALTYMMSECQRLIGDDGKPAGNWRPHLMVYYPYLTDHDLGLSTTPDSIGIVSDAGKPTASLIIIMPQFVSLSEGVRRCSGGR